MSKYGTDDKVLDEFYGSLGWRVLAFFFFLIKLLCLISFVKPSLSNEIIQSQREHMTGRQKLRDRRSVAICLGVFWIRYSVLQYSVTIMWKRFTEEKWNLLKLYLQKLLQPIITASFHWARQEASKRVDTDKHQVVLRWDGKFQKVKARATDTCYTNSWVLSYSTFTQAHAITRKKKINCASPYGRQNNNMGPHKGWRGK